ncbi:MAG: CU044_2847 family protein [Methylococcaceae bacterium]
MTQLQQIQLEDGTLIYIEAGDINPTPNNPTTENNGRTSRSITQNTAQTIQHFAGLQDTIKAFAVYSLNSFKTIATANVDKVTLEFGVNIGGEMGIPYITKGSVGSNLKITVECSFKDDGTNES